MDINKDKDDRTRRQMNLYSTPRVTIHIHICGIHTHTHMPTRTCVGCDSNSPVASRGLSVPLDCALVGIVCALAGGCQGIGTAAAAAAGCLVLIGERCCRRIQRGDGTQALALALAIAAAAGVLLLALRHGLHLVFGLDCGCGLGSACGCFALCRTK